MSAEVLLLSLTAGSIGFVHTLLGPDHYLPFIVMSRAGKWSVFQTALVTLLCGLGHVISSVVIGLVGVAFGIGVMKIEALEGFRGNLAAWLLIGFGFAYFAWGAHRAVKNKPHRHYHIHADQTLHTHEHAHTSEHAHVHFQADGHTDAHAHTHGQDEKARNITPWILFTIFVFGPCEPLIPILMYPAAKSSIAGMLLVTAIFGATTIATMLAIVMVSLWGMSLVPLDRAERYAHALAGGTICLCGLAIQFLGL